MSWETIKAFFASLTLEKVLPALVILVAGILLVKLLLKLLDKLLDRSKLDRTMFTILRATMRVLLFSAVVIIALDTLGVEITSLVAILSVVSLAISLAVQNLLTNVVGGMTLLMTQPFRVGDWVQIGNETGTVQEIGIHYTKIKTFHGQILYIPNSDAASSRICNYSANGSCRIDLIFTASYQDEVDRVKEAILEAADVPGILREPAPRVVVSEYGDSAICYLLQIWVEADKDKYAEVKFAVMEAVKRKFEEKKITIPFPQMDVHMKS